MSHVLAPYWAVKHRRPADYSFFSALRPSVVKLMDGGPPDYAWVRDNLPGALTVARDWLLDDNHGAEWQKLLADPVGTGKRHAQEWKAKQAQLGFDPATTLCQGLNEPKVWEQDHRAVAPTVAYTIAYLDELKRLGLRGVALSLSVGWPRNTGADLPPLWGEFPGVAAAILRGNHVLGLHEYWPRSGPAQGWGWLAGRALKCPWQVPILIGECGMSYAVEQGGVPTEKQGWRAHISDEVYAGQLVDYHNRMAADPRIIGLCVYLCDFASSEWWSKDLEPAYDNVLARKGQLRERATTPPVTPPVVEPPVTPVPATLWRWPLDVRTVTQWWGRSHGGIDYSCVEGTPVKACADGVVAWVDDDRKTSAANGGYGLYVRVWHPKLRIHTLYAHLSKQSVKAGDTVTQGQTIGLSGNTGNSTGPHLHFEVRLGTPTGGYDKAAAGDTYNARVDPMAFVAGLERA